jgi:hypothetical protein
MPVFYRGRRALITQDVFEVEYVGRLQYAIRDLRGVCIVQHDSESGPAARVMGLSALVAAFLFVPVVGPASRLLAGLAVGVFLIGGAVHVRRRSAVRWELVATYEGVPMVLFVSEDQTEFDQVCRGLTRALERQHDAR